MILEVGIIYHMPSAQEEKPKENKFLKMAQRILRTNPSRDATTDEALQEHFDALKAHVSKQH